MATMSNSTPQSTYNSITGMFGDWIRQGTEGFVATQKILLDLAAQQNALAITLVRERIGLAWPPSKKMADFSAHAIKSLMEAQRQMLELIARQNAIVSDGLKPALAGTPVDGLSKVIHQGFDNFLSAQKQFLNIVQSHTEAALTDLGDGKRLQTARLADAARECTRNFLDSQKKFLEIVEQELATKKETPAKEAKPAAREVDLLEMAKKSVDSLVKAQQALLDLASEQVKNNVEFAQDLFRSGTPPTSISDVMKKSVDSFVAAQKALLEVTSKPSEPAGPGGAPGKAAAA
jgi:hypothetical protein